MSATTNIIVSEKLKSWIGNEKSSPLIDDLEALTTIMPTLVLARIDASERTQSDIEAAVEVVALAIDNLRNLKTELFPQA